MPTATMGKQMGASGSFHIMLMQLQDALKVGDAVDLTLTFKKAGEMKVSAPARNP